MADPGQRLPDRSPRAGFGSARTRATRDHATGGGPGDPEGLAGPRLDPSSAAPAEHGRARGGGPGEVELPGRHGRRGPAPRALCGDRAGPEGRRGRRGSELRAAAASVHAARFRSPHVRVQPARRRCSRRCDRRLRRRRAQKPVHGRGHPRLLRPLPAQRDHRCARI